MLSIIIPSLRPDDFRECLKMIRMNTENYEVICVTEFELYNKFKDEPDCRFVVQSERKGVVDAVNAGQILAERDYICTLSDEARVQGGWADKMAKLIDSEGKSRVLGNFRVFERTWTPEFYYYGLKFSIFPFLHRDLLARVGGQLFSPEYRSFYADPDLGMRVWTCGGKVLTHPTASIYHPYIRDDINNRNRELFEDQDKQTFVKKWEHLGGEFYAEKAFVC